MNLKSSFAPMAALFSCVFCLLPARAANEFRIASPDGRIEVVIEMPKPASTERPQWSASFRGKPILTRCELGLETADAGDIAVGVSVRDVRERSVNRTIPVLFGKADHAKDSFHESRFLLETPRQRRFEVVFRAYNDAVAFRYELPKDEYAASVTINDETTSFVVAGNPTAYVQYLESYTTSHEHNVTTTSYAEIRPRTLMDMPLTLSWKGGTCAAITEASLRHYAGMSLMRTSEETSTPRLVCKLTPRVGTNGVKVIRPLPMDTPWRVVLVGDRPGALLESETLYCLNEPSVIKDTSWIKPGKITFSWWNGDVYDGKRDLPILSFAMAKKYIDFCASNGIPTHSLTSEEINTSPWYFQSKHGVAPGPDTDVTRTRPGFDLPAIRAYAESKHVRLWTWVHQGALRGKVEPAFAAFEKMGWSGMMVDFFDHDDQESVEFAESILQAAARHHILIHLHGVWKPTGWQRTYPNLMNHEGSLNLEYLKWSMRCTPEHDLMMAYTRLIAGPMDYHLGGFRAVTRSEFQPHKIAPNVLGTRCHQLAMYICFDNPNPMVADYPTAYLDQPGFDFIQLTPTWWNETHIVDGEIGEYLVTARRKGDIWYLGGMSARQPRDLELSLPFLAGKNYKVKLWKDAPDAETNPNDLVTETTRLSSGGHLKIHLALDGGFVAQLIPEGLSGK
jgi:alpha-glucosidase